MRLVTYDRGGERRLGAWVGRVLVDLPDAVGHPAFPLTMESFLERHGGSLVEAAEAALAHPDVLDEFALGGPPLLGPVVPSSVRIVRNRPLPPDPFRSGEVELACVLGGAGRELTIAGAFNAIFGYTLVSGPALGPTLVTADEVDPTDPRLLVTLDGTPFLEAAVDTGSLAAVVAHASVRGPLLPGDLFLFHAPVRPVGRRGRRVRPGSRIDLDVLPHAASGRASDTHG
jgi:hypothetical protein